MNKEELKSILALYLEDAIRQGDQSNWLSQKESMLLALRISLHLADPNEYALPRSLSKGDWIAFGWGVGGSLRTMRILDCTRSEAQEKIASQPEWSGVIPASVLEV